MSKTKHIKNLFHLVSKLAWVSRPDRPDTVDQPDFGSPADTKNMKNPVMIDFRTDQFTAPQDGGNAVQPPSDNTTPSYKPKVTTTNAIPVKPMAVLGELGRMPRNWDLNGLDAKIALLEEKLDLLTQYYAKEQVSGLIQCLRNRKHYDTPIKAGNPMTHREFWARYDTTDQVRIDALLAKYPDLVFKDADIFVPEFPADAISAMTACRESCQALCGLTPRFYVIANKELFRDAYGKRDPILLVQSPFGFFYHILGAWDAEMLYLPDL